MTFPEEKELAVHSATVHNFSDLESSLLKKAREGEKARKRSRGPYRKAHAA